MPARRCNDCAETWPQSFEFNKCPLCGKQTYYNSAEVSPYTRDEAMDIKEARALPDDDPPPPSPAHANRVERYLELGFSEVDAQLLAIARWLEKDSRGRTWNLPLNWQRVAAVLQQGCTHQRALEIFT